MSTAEKGRLPQTATRPEDGKEMTLRSLTTTTDTGVIAEEALLTGGRVAAIRAESVARTRWTKTFVRVIEDTGVTDHLTMLLPAITIGMTGGENGSTGGGIVRGREMLHATAPDHALRQLRSGDALRPGRHLHQSDRARLFHHRMSRSVASERYKVEKRHLRRSRSQTLSLPDSWPRKPTQ